MTYEEARRELLMLRGLSPDGVGRRPNRGFTDRRSYTAGGNIRSKVNRPGFYESGPQGVAPNEQEIRDFWVANGGGGKQPRRPNTAMAGGSAPAPAEVPGGFPTAGGPAAPKTAYEAMLMQAAGSLKSKEAEANAANQKRYDEEHGLATGVLNNGMAEIDNWGNVEAYRRAEKAQQNLDKINTDLTDYGLANSTNRIAAKLESDKNLALQLQDLSERKSDRMIQTNRTLTGDLRDVVRSRVDQAPDPNQLMAVYAKLGEAQAIDQARASAAAASGKPRNRSLMERIAAMGGGRQPRGMSGVGAARLAGQMQGNFMGGMQGAVGAVAGGFGNNLSNYGPAWTSNAFPHQRGESKLDAWFRRMG